MVTISVGNQSVSLTEFHEGWLMEQLQRQSVQGNKPCVQVHISQDEVNLALKTPECVRGRGGGRPPNPREANILELWSDHELDSPDWARGRLVAFLKQLRRLI